MLKRIKTSRIWRRGLDRLEAELKSEGLKRMTQKESTRLGAFLMVRAVNDLYRSVRTMHSRASDAVIERKVNALLMKWERCAQHWSRSGGRSQKRHA